VNKNKKQFIDDLVNDFASLYTAGTDTTEHSTMMLIYLINQHPEIKKKLTEEISNSQIDPNNLNFDTIKNLPYLDAVCQETLRMYQTGNGIFPRETLKEVTIGGVKFDKGSIITTQTFPVHFRSDLYEKPEKFIPERWLDEKNKIKTPQPFTFNSFSHGARSCIGKQLATQEMKTFTVYFLSKYETSFDKLEFNMTMHGFAYEPEPIKTKFWAKTQ